MIMHYNKKIVLENGDEYFGYHFGANTSAVLELVFNTSMVGYQEIFSDPSYTYQAVVMSYPLIGNYGMAEDDYESLHPSIGALIVRDYNDSPSNFRSAKTLSDAMKEYQIPGIYGVDTRKLIRYIRTFGHQKVLITDISTSREEALTILKATTIPTTSVSFVSCKEPYFVGQMTSPYHVIAIDCGTKKTILDSLQKRGCRITVVPWNTSVDTIKALKPDGVFISNGPGNPSDIPECIQTIQSLIGLYPIFGICLGHQIISMAYGAKTYKLKFGHRGGNHPVQNLLTKKIEITSQNHSYAVDGDSLMNTPLVATHINLLDNTIEGASCTKDRVFSVQYHPESAPGPQDSAYLFDQFIQQMEVTHHA